LKEKSLVLGRKEVELPRDFSRIEDNSLLYHLTLAIITVYAENKTMYKKRY